MKEVSSALYGISGSQFHDPADHDDRSLMRSYSLEIIKWTARTTCYSIL